MLHLGLIFDGTENLVDGELEQSEILIHFERSDGSSRGTRLRLLLEGALPPILVLGLLHGLVLLLWPFFFSLMLRRVIRRALCRLLELDVSLSSGEDITHRGDVCFTRCWYNG